MTDPRVDEFLTWALRDRGRAPNTVARYKAVLKQLPEPSTATLADVETWWATRLDKAPATRENELACLRSFYRWLTRFDHRPDDPTRRLDAPKVDNRFPRPIGRQDLDKALAATVDTPDMRRAICLGAYGGLRVSEAAALDWSDVDLERRRIYVRGKGAKERLMGLNPVLLDEMLPDAGGNVVTAGGKPYTGATLQRKVNRLLARLEIDHTFHNLRGRYVSLGISKTGNIHAVAAAVGWASIETANAYAALSDEALDQIAAAVV